MAKKKEHIPFNVINGDFNGKKFVAYDVMPYFLRTYDNLKPKDTPTTYAEWKEWVNRWSHYNFWARCEYEIIIVDWPCASTKEKWDVHKQIEMNLDLVTEIFLRNALSENKYNEVMATKK